MKRRPEQPALEIPQVAKIPPGAIQDAAGPERHQGTDQDLRVLLILGLAQALVVVFFLPPLLRRNQLRQVELREPLDGDAERDEPEARPDPRQERALRREVVPGHGARVLVQRRAEAGPEGRRHCPDPKRFGYRVNWKGIRQEVEK